MFPADIARIGWPVPLFRITQILREAQSMAAVTKAQETEKNSRVDKAMTSMKKPDKPEGMLRSIRVQPAENGYSVDVDRDPPASAKGKADPDANSPVSSWTPPKQHVFGGKTAKQDVLDHISQHLD